MGSTTSRPDAHSSPRDSSATCPVDHTAKPDRSQNPLNQIPSALTNTPAADQVHRLPLERTISSIPRTASFSSSASACPVQHSAPSHSSTSSPAATGCPVDHNAPPAATAVAASDDAGSGNWVYPSPQQFHNALARKGKATSEEYVESMVDIHNWLNETAWQEVQRWESTRLRSLWPGQADQLAKEPEPQLASFQGRPGDLSPKARYHQMLGKVFPNTYSSMPPFDRHDWVVYRPNTHETQRYVIDYYSCPDDEQGNPVFSLDVRPAVDSPLSIANRLRKWGQDKATAYGFEASSTSAAAQAVSSGRADRTTSV